jgi:AraC-like DNA-binding protein
VRDVLELAARRSGECAFGLRMAEFRRLSNLGPLGLLIRDEPTLRHALAAVLNHIHQINEAVVVRVEQTGNLVTLREEVMGEGEQSQRQSTELLVAVTFRLLRVFLGASWHPRLVCFSHRAPPSTVVHRRVFGDAVEFGHEFNGIVCHAADLDVPNPGADPVMARYAHKLLEQGPRRKARVSDRVREFIVLLLPLGHCRVEVVAQHLGVDRRTVARHLAAEGATFSELVDGVRRDLLARYLKEGVKSLTEVSALLGFAGPGAFSRWHRSQFGVAARTRLARRPSTLALPR